MTFRFFINLYQVHQNKSYNGLKSEIFHLDRHRKKIRLYADDMAIVVRGKFDIRKRSVIISKVPNKSFRMTI
jgi:hypothetical protein